MSIADDLENLVFPFDWQAHRYHAKGLMGVSKVIECIAIFLETDQEQAENLFLEFASKAQIDIFSLEPWNYTELCLPATREGAAEIFKHCKGFGIHCLYDEDLIILLSIEQVETMVNESIKGLRQPFSIYGVMEGKKRAFSLLDSPEEQKNSKTKGDRTLGTRERNNFLRIIAALAIELKIPLSDAYKAGIVIEALTDKLGEGLDHATIEMKIKEIQKLIRLPST